VRALVVSPGRHGIDGAAWSRLQTASRRAGCVAGACATAAPTLQFDAQQRRKAGGRVRQDAVESRRRHALRQTGGRAALALPVTMHIRRGAMPRDIWQYRP
jgi:hypothetical protein